MTNLQALELPNFARQFRFASGRIRRIRQRFRQNGLDVELILRVTLAIKTLSDQPKPILLRLRLTGVDEMRIQKRPGTAPGRLPDAHFGYFQGQFYVALDTWSLVSGERPSVHDFRAADIYFACRDLAWERVERKPS